MKWRHCEVYLPPAFGALSGASDAYGYNTRSEVTSARRAIGGAEVRGFSYDYAYDPIGNRTSATEYDESGAPLSSSYAANALNQYTSRTVPGYAAVRGEADTNAFVTVNERPVARTGAYFHGGDYADNTASNVWADLEIYAAINPPGTNTPDTVYAVTSQVFIAKTPELFTYDADGNMASDGRFTYTWNADNRMVMASNEAVVVTYAYDHRGRMVRKDIQHRGTEAQSIFYIWDNWNIIREAHVSRLVSRVTHNVWGLDLDGTLQGAGGVGGLLAVARDDGVFLPAYDANGNISEYVSTNGEVVAHYDYSPFGETLVASGPLASTFTHRFSTKPWCAVTKFSEYQMRKYKPNIGRWMSRDPIGELSQVRLIDSARNLVLSRDKTSHNTHISLLNWDYSDMSVQPNNSLYCFTGNAPAFKIDVLGFVWWWPPSWWKDNSNDKNECCDQSKEALLSLISTATQTIPTAGTLLQYIDASKGCLDAAKGPCTRFAESKTWEACMTCCNAIVSKMPGGTATHCIAPCQKLHPGYSNH